MKTLIIATLLIIGTLKSEASPLEDFVAASAVARQTQRFLGAFGFSPIAEALNIGSGLFLENCQITNSQPSTLTYQCVLKTHVVDSSGEQTEFVNVTLKQGIVVNAAVR